MKTKDWACPRCNGAAGQWKVGLTRAGSQRYKCSACDKRYTPDRKEWAYTEEERKDALRLMSLGMSGRKVGAYKKMHHGNIYRWSLGMAKKGASPSGSAQART